MRQWVGKTEETEAEEAVVAVAAVAVGASVARAKCTRQLVQTVVPSARFRLHRQRAGRFIAVTALQRGDLRGKEVNG